MKTLFLTLALALAAGAATAGNGQGNNGNGIGNGPPAVVAGLNGQINVADVTARVHAADIIGSLGLDELPSVTAAAIGNTLSATVTNRAFLDADFDQLNTAAITATVAGTIRNANVTAAAIGNSASFDVGGMLNPAGSLGELTGQRNTGEIIARVSGSIRNAGDVTAAAIGNSLAVTAGALGL